MKPPGPCCRRTGFVRRKGPQEVSEHKPLQNMCFIRWHLVKTITNMYCVSMNEAVDTVAVSNLSDLAIIDHRIYSRHVYIYREIDR